MRTIADIGISDEDDGTGYADWKDGPATVLDTVDALLAAHGLEVVMIDTGADDYLFKIEPRVASENGTQ